MAESLPKANELSLILSITRFRIQDTLWVYVYLLSTSLSERDSKANQERDYISGIFTGWGKRNIKLK